LPPGVRFHETTSDEFFADSPRERLGAPIDFAFIDGMHLFEFALRDFMNIERFARPGAVIVFDDIFPNHPLQAARERQTRAWTGDIWKIRDCLARHRPDLRLVPLDTWPSGLLLVFGADPASRVLADRYEQIVAEYAPDADPPAACLRRDGAVAPDDATLARLCAPVPGS
jgi:hypothetical protein